MSETEAPSWSECPECGVALGGAGADVAGEDSAAGEIRDGVIRVELECPKCAAPLALEIESALPEGFGAKMSLEIRRETFGESVTLDAEAIGSLIRGKRLESSEVLVDRDGEVLGDLEIRIRYDGATGPGALREVAAELEELAASLEGGSE